ncbi:MAG: hypothetical protein R3Y63_10710 [Eubacteriales bacterium]
MNYECIEKHLPPVKCVISTETYSKTDLVSRGNDLLKKAASDHEGVLICLLKDLSQKEDQKFHLFCPVTTEKIKEKLDYGTLPRTDVISIVFQDSYENLDLDLILQECSQYCSDRDLKIGNTCRILFHKEKRKWDRSNKFKLSEKSYYIEVQMEVEK